MAYSTTSKGVLRPGVTIIVTCKGRFPHLLESVPRLLGQRTSCEFLIVVVDYGDPDNCHEWVAAQKDSRLAAIRVMDEVEEFNLSRARNCGACVAPHELIAFADADALFEEGWLETAVAPIVSGEAVATIPDWPPPGEGILPPCGISVVRNAVFHKVRGFDESFRGWGHEDKDFIGRVGEIGAVGRFDPDLLFVIPHERAMRMTYYANKDAKATIAENTDWALRRNGLVNPNGYGAGEISLVSCSEESVFKV